MEDFNDFLNSRENQEPENNNNTINNGADQPKTTPASEEQSSSFESKTLSSELPTNPFSTGSNFEDDMNKINQKVESDTINLNKSGDNLQSPFQTTQPVQQPQQTAPSTNGYNYQPPQAPQQPINQFGGSQVQNPPQQPNQPMGNNPFQQPQRPNPPFGNSYQPPQQPNSPVGNNSYTQPNPNQFNQNTQRPNNPMGGNGAPPFAPVYNPVNANKNTDGLSIASLILGILSLLITCTTWPSTLFGIGAIITGAISRSRTKNPMALGGIITGIISVVVSIIWLIVVFALAFDGGYYYW